MATTKIWPVKTRLDHVLRYAEDEGKTENADWSKIGDPSLRDVMDYAMDDAKRNNSITFPAGTVYRE